MVEKLPCLWLNFIDFDPFLNDFLMILQLWLIVGGVIALIIVVIVVIVVIKNRKDDEDA